MPHLSAKVGVIGPTRSSEGLGQHQVVAAAILQREWPFLRVMRCLAYFYISTMLLHSTETLPTILWRAHHGLPMHP